MSCSSCKYLDENNKKNGEIGIAYYCVKKKKYVNGTQECENYEINNLRKAYVANKIYDEGRIYSNDKHSVFFYLVILIVMLILLIIVNL